MEYAVRLHTRGQLEHYGLIDNTLLLGYMSSHCLRSSIRVVQVIDDRSSGLESDRELEGSYHQWL